MATIYTLRQIAIGMLVALAAASAAIEDARAQAPTDPAAIVQSQEKQARGLAAVWLASGDARTRAWGAYLALRDDRHELLPQLIGLADAYSVQDSLRSPAAHSDHDAMVGVLDAVIQLGGSLPAQPAAKLYPEFPAQSIIFLARAGRSSTAFLLDIFRQEGQRTGEWLAAGNLLMNLKPPGFAAAVLGSFTVKAQLRVVDKGTGAVPGSAELTSCASGLPGPPANWPPVGNYYAARGESYYGRGATVLIGGAAPVIFVRTVGVADTDGRYDPCGFIQTNRDVFREDFLAGLAADPTGNPTVRSAVTNTLTWQNSTQYLKELRGFIDRQQGLFDALRKKLMDAGLLSADEGSSSQSSLEVRITDDRGNKPSALPVLPNAGRNVTILEVRR